MALRLVQLIDDGLPMNMMRRLKHTLELMQLPRVRFPWKSTPSIAAASPRRPGLIASHANTLGT